MSNRGRKRKFPAGYEPQPWHSPIIDSDVEVDNLLHGNVYGAVGGAEFFRQDADQNPEPEEQEQDDRDVDGGDLLHPEVMKKI